ncbi:MAG: fluoride efflux transporter CrcB [Calditrichaeota bacterium]|nr:fluoride efflux transporter CrcB [Calditrichota bacterium]MCB0316444.1 fluoride efflux transporter CrcB [Calditrichota bacterium]
MGKYLAIGLGGCCGALLRYWISGRVYAAFAGSDFPSGTLAVNLIGSFVLGLIAGLADHYIIHPNLRLFLTIGLLGAFTTFSTFSYETVMLMQVNSFYKAFLNVFVSVLVGLMAAFLGLLAGRGM